MVAQQCIRCELKFRDLPEVRDHLVRDHGLDPEEIAPHYGALPPGVHTRRRAPDPTHLAKADPHWDDA